MYNVKIDGAILCDSRIDELAIINPVVTLEANTAGTFEFTIAKDHPMHDAIRLRKSIISVYRDNKQEPVFQGICVEYSTDFYGQKKVSCEGELTYLNDSIQRPCVYHDITVHELLSQLIRKHNASVDESKRFEVGTVTVAEANNSIHCTTNYGSTMSQIKETLVDDLGGYIRSRYADGIRYIDYLDDSPRTNNQKIEIGKNLTDFNSNIDSIDIITAIIPLGQKLESKDESAIEERLTIESVNNGKDYIENQDAIEEYGRIEGTVTWDDVTMPSILKEKGEKYLSDTQFSNVFIEASAIDFGMLSETFDTFEILDKIHVISKTHGMDRYIMLSKQVLNLNSPENDRVTLGTKVKTSLSAKTLSANAEMLKQLEKVPTSSILQQAINSATSQITGAEGGFVKINYDEQNNPYEILIMDTDSIETAEKVWRWNRNGLGYSANGYNGPYGLAMTQDGQIVANFITSGTMIADIIKGGILKLGGNDNEYGLIEIHDKSGSVIGTWGFDGINIKKGSMSIGSNFSVSATGKLVAKDADITGTIKSTNAEITGGYIDVSTNVDDYSCLTIKYGTRVNSFESMGAFFKNGTNKTSVTASGVISEIGTNSATFNSAGTLISSGTSKASYNLAGMSIESNGAKKISITSAEIKIYGSTSTTYSELTVLGVQTSGYLKGTSLDVGTGSISGGSLDVGSGTIECGTLKATTFNPTTISCQEIYATSGIGYSSTYKTITFGSSGAVTIKSAGTQSVSVEANSSTGKVNICSSTYGHKLSFFGQSGAARQTVKKVTSSSVTLAQLADRMNELLTALNSYGLTNSSAISNI